MNVKPADDKAPMLAALQALLGRPGLTESAKYRVQHEIQTIRSGAKGETDAAYLIEFHCGSSSNVVTLHDLRLELDGRVAQIDHIIITRLFHVWICESKAFSGGVKINEHGEWSAYYGRRVYGIRSPIEQNKRHAAVLRDVFDRGLVDLPKRLGFTLKPEIKMVVLISDRAPISRPPRWAASRVEGLDRVIKADQLMTTIDREVEDRFRSLDSALSTLATAVSSETIGRLGVQLAAMHRPGSVDWSARFGIADSEVEAEELPEPRPAVSTRSPGPGRSRTNGTCDSCGSRVSAAVIAYCRSHSARFEGKILCMDCQRRVARA